MNDLPDVDPWAALADELGVNETVAPASAAPAADSDATAPAGPKKRRRRRARKPATGEAPATEAVDDAPADEEPVTELTGVGTDEPADGGDAKRKRRRRTKRKKVDGAIDGGKTDDEAEPATGLGDMDDEPAESFHDWKVPSWQELIDNLHRP